MRVRRIVPEILDTLAADDPRAERSRRDLRLLNAVMMHPGRMARMLLDQPVGEPPRSLLDLGAGDGCFTLALARRLARRWPDVRVTLLDRRQAVSRETIETFGTLGWRAETAQDDVFAFLETAGRYDVVTANLFLHHLDDAALSRLFVRLREITPLFAAIEPRRARFPLWASRAIWAVGANDVSRHDAPASVRAGFSGKEITRLWDSPPGWTVEEGSLGLFSHRLLARRISHPTAGTDRGP